MLYGVFDQTIQGNRIAIRKLTYQECNEFAACDVLVAGPEVFVDDGQSPAALPAVAIAANGMVGVLYDTFEGMIGGLPTFVTHLPIADERHGPLTLMAFLSSAPDSGDSSRRVLGENFMASSPATEQLSDNLSPALTRSFSSRNESDRTEHNDPRSNENK